MTATTPAVERAIVNAARSFERARALMFEAAKAKAPDRQARNRDYANARNVLTDALLTVAHRTSWVRIDGTIYSTDQSFLRIPETWILDLTPPPPEPPQ